MTGDGGMKDRDDNHGLFCRNEQEQTGINRNKQEQTGTNEKIKETTGIWNVI